MARKSERAQRRSDGQATTTGGSNSAYPDAPSHGASRLPPGKSYPRIELVIAGIAAFSSLALTVIACQGKTDILDQLRLMRESNDLARVQIKQTYRPIGRSEFVARPGDAVIIPTRVGIGTVDLVARFEIANAGRGLLDYVGSISYHSTTDLDFRSHLMHGELKGLSVDGMIPYFRGKPVFPGQTQSDLFVRWPGVKSTPTAFLYTCFLYYDQDDNLYDSTRLDHVTFGSDRPNVRSGSTNVDRKPGVAHSIERYNGISPDEIHGLLQSLASLPPIDGKPHPLIDYIARRSIRREIAP